MSDKTKSIDEAADATTWVLSEEGLAGLQGVVAVARKRNELFRMTVDITPGSLPRRKARFAFLDSSEPQADGSSARLDS